MLYQLYTNDITGELYLVPNDDLEMYSGKGMISIRSDETDALIVGESINNRFVGKNVTFIDYFLDLPLPEAKPIVMVPPPSLFTRVINLYKEAIKEL